MIKRLITILFKRKYNYVCDDCYITFRHRTEPDTVCPRCGNTDVYRFFVSRTAKK